MTLYCYIILANKFYIKVSSLHYVPHVGYSLGDRPLAGYDRHNSGGECLKGFRMALQVVSSGENSSSYLVTISAMMLLLHRHDSLSLTQYQIVINTI